MAEEQPSTPFERTLRAYDRVLQRQVLLKLPGAGAWDGWSTPVRERMLREARALAKARHDGIEPIHWVDVTSEGPLLVLDLPEGELLESRLAAGPLGVDQTRELGIQLAEALSAVHYHGIVHRAISVASVRMLADDRVRLGTFTFAKGFEARPMQSSIDHKRRTEPAIAPFLPPYVAPEQLAGQGANPRTDVFALGCLLYRCLTGSDPVPTFGESNPLSDLRTKRPDVPKAFCEVLRRCTHLAATARYPSAQAAAEALRATRPAAKGAPLVSRRAVLAAGGLLALGLGGLGYLLGGGANEPGQQYPRSDPGGAPLPTATFAPNYARCHALLIGVAQAYDGERHVKLNNPVNEVTEVRNRLIATDPEHWRPESVQLLTEHEADNERILQALERLEKEAQPEDAVLLYFSGHGVKEGAHQYWLVPAGTTGRDSDPNHGHGYLPAARIHNFFSTCKAKHVLAVLDCCYSGSLFAGPLVRGDPPAMEAGPLFRGRPAKEQGGTPELAGSSCDGRQDR